MGCNGLGTHYWANITPTDEKTPEQQAIEQLQEDVSILKDEMLTVQTDVDALEAKLQTDVDALEAKVQALPLISTDNVVMIGDSFLDGYLTTTPSTDNWGAQLVRLLSIPTYIKVSEGGAGYLAAGNVTSRTFSGLLNDAHSQSADPAKVTAVIIVGGVNDYDVTDNFSSAVTATINLAHTLFPNASIVPVYSPAYKLKLGIQYIRFAGALRAANVPVHTPAMSYTWMIGRTEWFNSDHLHPTTAGQAVIAKELAAFLVSGTDIPGAVRTYVSASSGTQGVFFALNGSQLSVIVDNYATFAAAEWHTVCALPDWIELSQDNRFGFVLSPADAIMPVRFTNSTKTLDIYSGESAARAAGTASLDVSAVI